MPLYPLIQLECDNCGNCDYSLPPKSYAKQYFLELGYITINGRWYCDEKCKKEHKER